MPPFVDPIMLRSEHVRILAACQARYDAGFERAYGHGRWDGFAIGLGLGAVAGVVISIGFYLIATGQL